MNGMNGNVLKMGDKSPSLDCGEEQKLIPSTTPTTPMIVQVTKNPYSSLRYRSRYRAGPTRKLRRRAVLKNGDCNVLQSRISRRSLRFLQDIFTTLVDTQWRWTLMCFMLSFILSWLGFAVIWWLIAFTHGDFEEDHLPPLQIDNNWTPCVYNIFSFTSCFLFSIETQHTIGYGSRSTTEECPEAIFIMCLQSITGVMIQAFMVGIVFAKMTRPKQRTQTLLFSRNAVICQRDGELCLMFRVGDMRKSHIIGASVRAQMIRSKTTKEGEILSQYQEELVVGTDGENGDLFFIWPATIIHRINESSPFFNMSAEDMLIERFEVVLILEGTIESTGQSTQARSSYLPQEILWGHRFDPVVSYSKERQGYEVDYSQFNSTTQVDTPLCSGRELAEFYKTQDNLHHGTSVLINKDHLMRRECECDCHPINHHCLQLLIPSDCTKSHNSLENEYYWQNICKCSNCMSYEPETVGIDQSKMFDFDAIQVIEDEELQQLPEAINKEIVKNSQEIVFEEEENVSERNLIKLNDIKSKLYNQEIISEEKEEDVLMQRAMEKDMINKETKEDNQEIVFEEKKEDALMQTALIKMNKDKDKILKHGQKIVFKEEKRDFSERYIIRLQEEKADILKNSTEIMYEEPKGNFLKRNMNLLNEKNDNLKNCQEAIFKQEEGALERKLVKFDEGNSDILKHRCIYDEKEQLAFIKIEKNPEDIRHLIRHTLYKPKQEYKTRSNEFAKKDYEVCLEKSQRLHNRKCQLFMLVNQDQKNIKKNTEKNIVMKKEQNSQKKFDRSLSDDFLTINDERFFKESIRNKNNKLIVPINQDKKNPKSDPFSIEEHNSSKKHHRSYSDYFVTIDDRRSKEIAISNMKNVRIERDQISTQQIPKYPVVSLDHLNSKSIFEQQLDYDFLRCENGSQVKQHDNIRIENEKTLRKSSRHLTKIAIQDKLYSNDSCSLVSPIYDLSPESGFCEGGNCRECLMSNTLKNVENTNSIESNLSRENISDISSSKECTKNHIVEAITSINNSIRDDELTTSSHFNLSFNKSIDDGNNLVKYAAASNIKERIICTDYGEQNIHEAKLQKYRCPNTSSRKLVSNLDESEEPSSSAEKQLIYRKNSIQNIDEELMTQKCDFLNVNASHKHFIRDSEYPEWFDSAVTVEKQIDYNIIRTNERKSGDFSNSNTLCENIVDDVVLDHLKQYSNSVLTEEQVYSNKVEDRTQFCNSSNSNISYKNVVNDIVNFDLKQCDDDFIPEDQVIYKSKINDNDMTNTENASFV